MRVFLWVLVVGLAGAFGVEEVARGRAVKRAVEAEEWAATVEAEAAEWVERARGR